jgi:hypothetical protein
MIGFFWVTDTEIGIFLDPAARVLGLRYIRDIEWRKQYLGRTSKMIGITNIEAGYRELVVELVMKLNRKKHLKNRVHLALM